MSSRRRRGSALDAYRELNIVTALALMGFAVVGLVQTGLMLDIVELLTQYKFLTLAVSFAAFAVIFASSDTRNPDNYHVVELLTIAVTSIVMIAHAAFVEVQNLVSNLDPFASIVVMILMVVTGAILGK
ncbi:hypothetical protein [Halosimplex halophilum]|uniref:hypothetical protein n=1 Tax=Halosimplex halophilum TaxID=2559572 RepID=UPI00107F9F54|nr:hypothetical protein [Halosimplex halophilum]